MYCTVVDRGTENRLRYFRGIGRKEAQTIPGEDKDPCSFFPKFTVLHYLWQGKELSIKT